MTISSAEWKYEEYRLKKVLDEVKEQLEEKRSALQTHKTGLEDQQMTAWKRLPHLIRDFDDVVELSEHLREVEIIAGRYKRDREVLWRLEKVASSPYFGRVDFQEEGTHSPEEIYIGLSSLVHKGTGEHLIYDWRAPISSIFYDFELGQAAYPVRDGLIEGQVTLKRQYRIVDGRIEYIFDSSLKIDDLILQKILSESTDGKMREIVKSIQREQNKVIRDDKHKLLLVQGPAGSGKTSIALHRIAYLLYKHRGTLSSNEVVIFSPNQVFSDYISDVLPELGEENVIQSTFDEYGQEILGGYGTIESWADMMEYLLSCKGPERDARVEAIEYKASRDYAKALEEYVTYLVDPQGSTFEDLEHNGQRIASKEELTGLFYNEYAWLPLKKRLDKIRGRLFYLIEPIKAERIKEVVEEIAADPDDPFAPKREILSKSRRRVGEEFKPLTDKIVDITSFDVYDAYCKLFEGEFFPDSISESVREQTLNDLREGIIRHEDMAPLLFLKMHLEGEPILTSIKYVIIDEAQDYSPLQYQIIEGLFPNSSITLLGDLDQSLSPYTAIKDWTQVMDIFQEDDEAIIGLTQSYRSTHEIFSFARALLPDDRGIKAINRNGELPRVSYASSEGTMLHSIVKDILELMEEGVESIALICKTAGEALRAFNFIGDQVKTHLITSEDTDFKRGILIIPVYLAKGLEFDAVLIYNAGAAQYHGPGERKLLYTGITRALHRLHIYYTGAPSPFLPLQSDHLFQLI